MMEKPLSVVPDLQLETKTDAHFPRWGKKWYLVNLVFDSDPASFLFPFFFLCLAFSSGSILVFISVPIV